MTTNRHPQAAAFFCSLLLLAVLPLHAENIVFPADSGAVNVKEKYGAKGDGQTDDTAALTRAIEENKGQPGTLYFPNGTYLVSDMMNVGGTPHSRDRFLVFQGQSQAGTIIRLKDAHPLAQRPEGLPPAALPLRPGTPVIRKGAVFFPKQIPMNRPQIARTDHPFHEGHQIASTTHQGNARGAVGAEFFQVGHPR